MPRQRQDRHLQHRHSPALDGPLHGLPLHRRAEARRPVPALHDRRRLRHPRQARRLLQTRSRDRPGSPPTSPTCPRSPSTTSTSTSSPPIAAWWRPRPTARIYDVDRGLHPLERRPCRPDIEARSSALDSGPGGAPCPGQVRPFEPRLEAGTSNPVAGAFSDFTLKLDRDDGDQFLGDLNFKMPPGLHRRPARHLLLPGGRDRRRRGQQQRPRRAGESELPGLQPGRHHQRRRRTRLPPLPRGRAGCTSRARSRALR